MIPATACQQHVLRFIAGHIEAAGRAPTYSEIAFGCGFASKANAHRAVERLAERGQLTTLGGISITGKVAIPHSPDGAPLHFVPIREARR